MEKLLLLSLLLSGCASTLKPTPYVMSVKNRQCAEYKVVQDNPIQFAFVAWHPISECDGFFALPPPQAAEALREYRNYQSGQ